jgi:hypothetical protein
MVLEKRKSFMQKSGTKRSLLRLRLRLFHAMLDIVLIVCLVIFAVALLVSNDWDCLMSLWKNHGLFLLFGSINLVFSLMFYLGWLGACLQHVWHIRSRHKPLWSRSSLCNHTCCVCWDLMSIGTMSSWCVELYLMLSLCCLWSCMLSVASSYLGRVDASDSKREYLCSIFGFMPLFNLGEWQIPLRL